MKGKFRESVVQSTEIILTIKFRKRFDNTKNPNRFHSD
jgi:hypothetical protein